MSIRRVASVIALRPDKEAEYRKLHREVWPEILDILRVNGISNYSIFVRDGMLFSYLEFVGDDFEAAMKNVSGDELTQCWWTLTDPCQDPIPSALPGERWVDAEELFHMG